MWAPGNASGLPVFFFTPGGGFNSNGNIHSNGSGLVIASCYNIVIVKLNYRVGPYGFLAGREIQRAASLNNGLKDQIKALQWVQKHITQFGGDPDHVTIGGDSAGAASVSLLMSAYNGTLTGLFHAAAAESPSFGVMLDVNESQNMYDGLVKRTHCTHATDTLSCLRNLSAHDLQVANKRTPLPGAPGLPLFMYSPTIDGDVVPDYSYNMFASGRFLKLPTIIGDNLNGGTSFAPRKTNSRAQYDAFLKDQFPKLTPVQLARIHALYPVAGTPKFRHAGRYWRALANAYGDMRYKCPGLFLSSQLSSAATPTRPGQTWNYLWNVSDPAQMAHGYGVPHVVEFAAIWGPPYVAHGPKSYYPPHGINHNIVPLTQSYWTSFIRSYNPNTYRADGAPEWTLWNASAMERIVFITNRTAVDAVALHERTACEYLVDIGPSLAQ